MNFRIITLLKELGDNLWNFGWQLGKKLNIANAVNKNWRAREIGGYPNSKTRWRGLQELLYDIEKIRRNRNKNK